MRNISFFFVTSLFLTSFSKSISKEISSTFAQAVRKISRSSLTAEKPFCKRSDRRGRSRHFKITVADVKDSNKLYDELKANGQLLVEEAIVQSDDLNEINPCVVNSWRVVTLYKDGKAHIINNALRINQDESNVIGCTNDLYLSLDADGRIDSNVIDDYGNVYDKHPMTGKKFSEVKIAGVREALDMVVEAAERFRR